MAIPAVPQVPIGGVPGSGARDALAVSPVVGTAPTFDPSGFVEGLNSIVEQERANDQARDEVRSIELVGQFARAADERAAELDPRAPDYRDRVAEIYREAREGIDDQIKFSSVDVSRDFDKRIANITETALIQSVAIQRDAIIGDAKRVRTQEEEAAAGRIRQDPLNTAAYKAELEQTLEVLNRNIPSQELLILAEFLQDKLILAEVEGLASLGDFTAAKKLIEDSAEVLSTGQATAAKRLVRTIQNEIRADALSQSVRTVADLEIAIDRRERPLDQLDREVDLLERLGVFEGRQDVRVRLKKQIETARQKDAKRAKTELDIMERFNAGRGLNTQKEAAIAWERYVEDLEDSPDPVELQKRAVTFAKQSGFVPPPVTNAFVRAERTDAPGQLAAAAILYSAIQDANPGASGLEQAKDRVLLTVTYTEIAPGINAAEAADLVISKLPDAKTRRARNEQFSEVFKDLDPAQTLADADLFDLDAVTPELSREYTRTLQTLYLLNGDPDVATRAAQRFIAQRFSVTQVNGVVRTVEAAPEQVLAGRVASLRKAAVEDIAELIRVDVEEFMGESGIKPAVVTGSEDIEFGVQPGTGAVDPETGEFVLSTKGRAIVSEGEKQIVDVSGRPRFQLIADETTKQDLAAGRSPRYILAVRNSLGAMEVVTLDGLPRTPFRYTLPSQEEVEVNPVFKRLLTEAREPFEKKQRKKETLSKAAQAREQRREALRPKPIRSGLEPRFKRSGLKK